MKSGAMIDQVRQMRMAKHSIRKITESLGISRNTVRKYIRMISEVQGQGDEKPTVPWQLNVDWDEIVAERQRGVTILQLYSEHDPAVSYSRFCRTLKSKLARPAKTALRLNHKPGERTQVDFADGIPIYDRKTGAQTKTHLFCATLPFSGHAFGEFVLNQQLPTFIRCHEHMWAYFGGMTPYVVLDNLKSGVKKAHRYDPDINPTYCDFGNKSGFAALPARPYTPRDKASVEATIGVIQREFYQEVRNEKFYSLSELNERFRQYMRRLANSIMKDYGVSRIERFATEREKLLPIPNNPYEISEWKTSKVHPDCCIQVFKALYSVPFRLCGQEVRVKATGKILEIFDRDLNSIACHIRQPTHGQSIKDDHLPPTRMQETQFDIRKSQAIASTVGPRTEELVDKLLSGMRPLRYLRRVQGILRLRTQGFSNQSMEYASGKALTFSKLHLAYIKSCAEYYRDTGGKLRIASDVPRRDPKTTHLHGD